MAEKVSAHGAGAARSWDTLGSPAEGRKRRVRLNGRHEVLLIAVSAAQTCLAMAWFTTPSNPLSQTHPLALIAFVFLSLLGSAWLVRLTSRLEWTDVQRAVVVLAGLLATIGIGLTAVLNPGKTIGEALATVAAHLTDVRSTILGDVSIAGLSIVTWWLGQENAQRLFSVDSMRASLRRGIALWAAFAVLVALHTRQTPPAYFAGYFLSMLLALALARSEELQSARLANRSPFGASWFASTGATTLGFVAIATGTWLALGTILIELAWGVLLAIQHAVLLIAIVLSTVFGQILGNIELPQPGSGPVLLPTPQPTLEGGDNPVPIEELEFISTQLGQLMPLIVLLVAAVLIAIVVARARRRVRRTNQAAPVLSAEERAGGPDPAHGTPNAHRLARWARRLRRGPSRWIAARTIRRIYAQTIALAGVCGAQRRNSTTPYEYLPTLVSLFPGVETELEQITEAYVRAHYGELPDTPERLAEVREAFQRIRAEGDAVIAYRRAETHRHNRRFKDAIQADIQQGRVPRPRS